MPTFDALLQATLDEPDEDVPRQILGDYLLDQPGAGDHARGAFDFFDQSEEATRLR